MTTTLAAAAAVFVLLGPGSAQAFQGILNTGPGSRIESFGHVTATPSLLGGLLAIPFDLAASPADAAAALLSPSTPESDLADALGELSNATSAAGAGAARQRALDILEGNDSPALARTAYRGIGLLNWKVKVKDVPARGTVTIRQVRWGEHVVSDTWLLRFADPASTYSIRYEVVELGAAFGGELDPTPLLRNGDTVIGGQHSAIQPLAVDDNRDTGTRQSNRFTLARDLGAVAEQTRSAVQTVTVAMPPPSLTSVILDPNLRPGHEAVATLKPATPAQIAGAEETMGHVDGAGDEQNKLAAIAKLSDQSPEKQIWTQLHELGDVPDDPDGAAAYLAAAKTAGSANAELVGEMRTRSELPAGVDSAGADVTVVLQNNEAYVSRTALRLEPGTALSLRVVNRDRMTHRISALDLHDRSQILGATDWGEFRWSDRTAAGAALGPGEARTLTLELAGTAFALWVGDLGSGDQAGATIAVDREIRHEALGFGAGTLPVHSAPAPNGDMWVTLSGVDEVARIRPAANLAESQVERFPLPGASQAAGGAAPAPLAPSDVTVDGRGIVWATLSSGNAIARIDPALARPGTSDGMKLLPLDPCPADVCRPEVPPVPNERPTRRPTRLKSYIDGQGHIVLWFTEAGASRIGVMRVSESGAELAQAHFACGCEFPESLDLGPDGSVWFAEVFENRIGRVIPDRTMPYTASAATVQHFDIPRSTDVDQPPLTAPVKTSLPLSVAVDGRNRVWFSQSALSTASYLDPAEAVPGTSSGFTELPRLPDSDFGSPAAPADVMVDRANGFWWTGEYGDQIEQRKPDGSQGLRFRGSVRRGLTEGPVADAQGNLWVVESGGNLITRISDVTAGPLRAFGLPAGYEADTTRDRVSGVRLRDTTSVRVRVIRDSAVVASATVPVRDGAFEVTGADWNGGGDQVRPDDVVRILPEGPYERAELALHVAKLTAAVRADGSVAGTARSGTQALADRIVVTAGGATSSAAINGGNGAWSIDPPSPLPQDAALTLAWSGATVAGTLRTVTSVSGPQPQPQPQPPGRPDPSGADASAGANNGAGQPAATAGTAAPAAPEATTTAPPTARDGACANRRWLYGDARRPSVLLLGMTRAQVVACIGKPRAKTAARGPRLERWTYGRGLALRFRAGRVRDFELRDGALRTSRLKAGIGSPLSVLRRELPGLRRDPRSRLQRVLVRRSDGRFTDIRVRLDNAHRIRHIGVTLRTRSELDTFARSLLRTTNATAR